MSIMSVPGTMQVKSVKKYVLQQSNCNLDVSHERAEDESKQGEKTVCGVRLKEDASLETENQCGLQRPLEKSSRSDAKKLRSVRLDLSSLKRGVIQKNSKVSEFSSGESSEDEARGKRKPRPVVPNYVTNSESGPCRRPRQSRQDPLLLSSHSSPKTCPQSLSIARRNARERNRVKQVNEGFATLRSRIPEYISEAYNEEKGRKSAKKLSKVETLRMAVDYIRHLETLLELRSTEKEVWMKEIKMEEQPWDTPNSGEYLSPRYQPPCVESPGGTYDQGFEYQDRIFYEYDLDLVPRKECPPGEKKTFPVLGVPGNESENQCVDDFKYYETFNRIKKEASEAGSDEKAPEEEEDLENLQAPPGDSDSGLLPKDVIKKVPKKPTVLPPITESFNKTIPVFF